MVHEELNNATGLERTEPSVLDDILNTADVDLRDKIVTLIDLVSGGIETVCIAFFENGVWLNTNFSI